MARLQPAEERQTRSVAELYIDGVLAGEILTSKFVRLQIERHQRDLALGPARGLHFNREKAQRPIDFFALFLRHTEGEWIDQPFILQDWQQALLWMLYGWEWAKTGNRRFKFAYNEQARGQGKSALASGLCVFELVAFGEPGAQVYVAATDKETAKLVFDTAALMVAKHPSLRKKVTHHLNNLHIKGTASKFKPLSSKDNNLMGKRPSFICIDELHMHTTSGVWDVMISAMGKRKQSLLFAITNSGYDRHSVCWRQREYSVKILEGVLEDDTWFAWIAGLDEEDVKDPDGWEDESKWVKANPALGTIVQIDDMRSQAKKAKADPSALNSFLRFRLGVWTTSDVAWMPAPAWAACGPTEFNLEEWREFVERLIGRACYAGLDLSTTTDISAFVLLFPPTDDDPKWCVIPYFFLPEDNIAERVKRDRVPYDVWKRQGLFELTRGNVIDYDAIRARINELGDVFQIQQIAFDRWNSQQIVTQLADDGFTTVKFGQGFESLNAPTKRLMELVLRGELSHGGNPVLRWMASNATVDTHASGFIKLDKAKSREKIDGIAALINALGQVAGATEEANDFEPFVI